MTPRLHARPAAAFVAGWTLTILLFASHGGAQRNAPTPATDPLPGWYEGDSKRAIVAFVQKVTQPGGEGFVPAAERIAVFGNSDGDLEMLQWTAAGAGSRLCHLVHHIDAAREWAYDRTSSIGRLDKALDEAKARAWTVVSMRDDEKAIYPAAK
jgi:hypothetical protein